MTIDGRALARPSTQKARALLAYLAMRRGAAAAREEIVETFWPEADPDNARQSLKTALWSIRRCIRDAGYDPAEVLVSDNFTVRWITPTSVDAAEFEDRARARDTGAIELYAGDFLPGDYDDWSAAQRERLIDLLEMLLARKLEAGGDVADAQRLLAIDPFNEAAYATLIAAETAANRTIAARSLLQRFREVLRTSGLEPSAEFEARFVSLEKAAPGPPGFIGRASELAAFEASLRAKHSVTMLVYGDAGFGKTALLERFRRRAAEAGRSLLSLSVTPERSGFGGWERVYAERTGRAFDELIAERGSSLPAALTQAIVATIAPGSYAFVDDAHRLDGDAAFVTAAILSALAKNGTSVVFATRPEGLRRLSAAFGSDAVVELPLEGFSQDEIFAALPARAGEREALARSLFERTQGHPLFLQRLLERAKTGSLEMDMPVSVRALIEERLRERGEDAALVASLLALDRRFGADELASVLEWGEERVLDAIDDLLAIGIVRESSGSSHLEFAHDVVMEVARDTLSPLRRKRLHRLASAILRGASSLADLARAAEHQAAAGEALAAAQSYLRCSESALAAFEPRNAAVFAENGRDELSKVERAPEIDGVALRLDVALIKGLNASSEPERAAEVASQAIALARERDDAAALFELVSLRMRARMRASDVEAVEADAKMALELASAMGDRGSLAEAALGMLQSAMHRLNERDALHYGRLAFDAAMESGQTDLAVFVASEYLHAEVVFWHFAEGLETLRRVDAVLASASVPTEPNFQYAAATLMYLLDDYEEAERRVTRGLALLENRRPAAGKYVPDRGRTVAILTNTRALAAIARGDWEAAWAAARAFAEHPAVQIPAMRPHAVDLCARVLLGRNGPGDSERVAALLATVDEDALVGDTLMYVRVAKARLAARTADPLADAMLGAAVDLVLATAASAGLDCDLMFADLASAAAECGAGEVAGRAAALRDEYRRRRLGTVRERG